MNDEIKEILDLLNFNRDTISNGTCRVEDFMSREQIIKLLDYITNLQETIDFQDKWLEYYKDFIAENNIKDYKSRIEKAVEYIRQQNDYFNEYPLVSREKLLNILNGKE